MSALEADAEVEARELTVEAVADLDRLEPCGTGNPRPVLVLRGARDPVHVPGGPGPPPEAAAGVPRATPLDAIFFSADGAELGLAPGGRVDVAFYPQINEFRGTRSVQLQVADLQSGPHPGSGWSGAVYAEIPPGGGPVPGRGPACCCLPGRSLWGCGAIFSAGAPGWAGWRTPPPALPGRPPGPPDRGRPCRAGPAVPGGAGGAGADRPGAPARRGWRISLRQVERQGGPGGLPHPGPSAAGHPRRQCGGVAPRQRRRCALYSKLLRGDPNGPYSGTISGAGRQGERLYPGIWTPSACTEAFTYADAEHKRASCARTAPPISPIPWRWQRSWPTWGWTRTRSIARPAPRHH